MTYTIIADNILNIKTFIRIYDNKLIKNYKG